MTSFPEIIIWNHSSISGPGNIYLNNIHLNKLVFELELDYIIGKEGKNIPVNEADDFIFGFMIKMIGAQETFK